MSCKGIDILLTERLHSLLNVAVLFFVRPGYFLPYGHGVSSFGKVWDACAARGKAGPVMGLRPLRGPPCIPPEAPPKRAFNFLSVARATRLLLRELPSLATLAQAISLRAALMPKPAFALGQTPFQPIATVRISH